MTVRTATADPWTHTPQPRHEAAPGGAPEQRLDAQLAIVEANLLLREGGYGLRVEQGEAGILRLAGPGTGTGLPLGSAPTWAALYRALVRLRRTRSRHDPAWLHRLTRAIEADGSPRDVRWTRLPLDRVERLSAPGASATGVWRWLDVLAEDGYLRLPTTDSTAVPEPRRTDERTVGCGEVFGAECSVQLTTGLAREEAREQLHGWSSLASVLAEDPLLRMHCAVRPAPAALVDSETGSAVLARLIEPSPPHPEHPGGTFVVGLPALLRPGSDGAPALLRQVVENRFERRENELGYFAENLVRPLLRSFRTALDEHRLGLLALDVHGVGVELSPEFQATGRIVVTEFARVRERSRITRAELRAGVEALTGTLDALVAGFSRLDFGAGAVAEQAVRAAVDRVLAEELRYLHEHTAELLAGDQRLRGFAHAVPPEQDAVLKDVLHAVEERTRLRRWNPDRPQPAVVIDLDLCGLVPPRRTLEATRAIAAPRPGAPGGIPELAEPGSLPVLPTYAESTWRTFVEVSGLAAKYPDVDWRQVHEDFFHAFARPRSGLRTDAVNAGLARFVWDVRDAGGLVVFCTGRRERVREHTEAVLAAGGVPESVLLCVPDDRTRPIPELKVELLRGLGAGVEVVAVFDDMRDNRAALTEVFDGARAVAVEVPGLATERHPDEPVADGAPVIATFETSPRTSRRRPVGAGLSYAHSLEELQVGALRRNRPAHGWAVRLSSAESMSIVDYMLSDTDRAAARTAQGARAKFELDRDCDPEERQDRLIRALHHVFTRKQFLKGARSNYRVEHMRRDVEPFVRRREPIDVVLLGFPVKQCLNRLKASGPLPDFAELGGLTRLRELQRAVRGFYPPGLRFNILTDGRHFRPRPASITGAYGRKLREYVELVGIGADTVIEEVDAVAVERLGAHLPAERARRIEHYQGVIERLLERFDITENPLRTLERIGALATESPDPSVEAIRLFPEMLMSVVYSVPLPVAAGMERVTWSMRVYADLYNLTDRTVPPEVRQARVAVLRRAWHAVIRYLAIMRVDEEFDYEGLFPDRVRLTVSAARPGRCGFTYLGGSGLLPWQGTGAVDSRGRIGIDFSVSLLDQGFVPVYSPVLGPRQPWLMVPAQHVRQVGRTVRLDEEFAERIRLRRK